MCKFIIKDPQFLPHIGCDIELNLNEGEVVVIAGENGLGKTSLVHKIYDKNKSDISLVEQKPIDFFYDRKVGRLKDLFIEVGKKDIHLDHFSHYWKMFKLDSKEKRFLSSLSGGESQALKICLGLAIKRNIYIMDEASQFLDVDFKRHLNTIIEQLIFEKKSILLVEHDLSWAKIPFNRFPLFIKDGVLRGIT